MTDFIRDWAEKEFVSIYAIHEEENDVNVFCYGVHYQDLIKLQSRIEGWHIAFVNPHDDELIEIQLLKNK